MMVFCIQVLTGHTLRGLNFADFADLGKNAKLSPGEKFATGHPRN